MQINLINPQKLSLELSGSDLVSKDDDPVLSRGRGPDLGQSCHGRVHSNISQLMIARKGTEAKQPVVRLRDKNDHESRDFTRCPRLPKDRLGGSALTGPFQFSVSISAIGNFYLQNLLPHTVAEPHLISFPSAHACCDAIAEIGKAVRPL